MTRIDFGGICASRETSSQSPWPILRQPPLAIVVTKLLLPQSMAHGFLERAQIPMHLPGTEAAESPSSTWRALAQRHERGPHLHALGVGALSHGGVWKSLGPYPLERREGSRTERELSRSK